jgi:hypothetical protein
MFEACWLAGILDGEGALYIGRKEGLHHADGTPRVSYSPEIRISMADAPSIEHASAILKSHGVACTVKHQKARSLKWKPQSLLRIGGMPNIVGALRLTSSMLVTKARHAVVLRAYCERREALQEVRYAKGRRRTQRLIASEDYDLYAEMLQLNARGPLASVNPFPERSPVASPENLSWLAGLLDGEGYLGVRRSRQSTRVIYGPVVAVEMCDESTVRFAQQMVENLGVFCTLRSYAPRTDRSRARHRLSVDHLEDALRLLEGIAGELITKKAQATVLTRFCLHRLAHPPTTGALGRFSSTYTLLDHELHNASASLNKRGP